MMLCKSDPKRYWVGTFAVALVFMALDFVIHHRILMGKYQETMSFWRPMEEAQRLMPWAYLGYIVFALLFNSIFSFGYEAGKSGWGQGIRYGLWVGLLYWGSKFLLQYPWTPYPSGLYFAWFFWGMVEFVILGGLVGWLYRPRHATA